MHSSLDNFRATPPEVSAVPAISLPSLHRMELPGGVTLALYDSGDVDVCRLTFIKEGGRASLSPEVAALLPPMMKEGSSLDSPEQLADLLDFYGAWLTTSISSYHHTWNFYFLNSKINEVIDHAIALVSQPAFFPDNFEMLRESAVKALEISLSKVKFAAEQQSTIQAMGPANPLSRNPEVDSLSSLSHPQFLSEASDLASGHITVLAGGKISDSVRSILIDRLSSIVCAAPSATPSNPFSTLIADRITIPMSEASQSAVLITLPAPPRRHPDYIPLHIAVGALGGYFGSRLMLNIREKKGFTYGISAGLMGYPDGSFIRISAECDNTHVENLIREVKNEMLLLASNPPDGDELFRLRQALSASLLEAVDTPFNVVNFHSTMIVSGIPDDYFNRKVYLLNSITPEEIAAIADKYLRPEAINIAIAGNPA